jgi:hypothetical protein
MVFLRAWLADVRAWDVEVLAFVVDLTYAVGDSIQTTLSVHHDCIIPPTALPELIKHCHVLLRNLIPHIMGYLLV